MVIRLSYTKKVEPPINKLIRENTLKKYEVGYNSLLYKDVELINNQIGLLDLKEDKTKKYLLFSNLTQLLKYKPELCKSVADLATSLNPEKVDYTIHIATLLGALASSKTAEAEETLAELLKLKSHEKISIQAAIYLNNFPNPSNKSIESLTYILNSKPLGSDLYRASLLSLGSVAGNSDKAVSDKIIKSLLKELRVRWTRKILAPIYRRWVILEILSLSISLSKTYKAKIIACEKKRSLHFDI